MFASAGLWEIWREGVEPIEASHNRYGGERLAREIHDRMPVIIDPDNWAAWPKADDTTVPQALLQPYPAEQMRCYPVHKRVNSPKNNAEGSHR